MEDVTQYYPKPTAHSTRVVEALSQIPAQQLCALHAASKDGKGPFAQVVDEVDAALEANPEAKLDLGERAKRALEAHA